MGFVRLDLPLVLAVRSPFLFRGLQARFVGVDVAHLRSEEGLPIIPADQAKGVFRQALGWLEEVGAVPPGTIRDLFGRSSGGGGEDDDEREATGTSEPDRGRIVFSDLTARALHRDPGGGSSTPEVIRPSTVTGETTRVEIDDALGSVKAGALQVIELIAPFGAVVVFEGGVSIFAPAEEARSWHERLAKALALVPSIGAMKSPGWGEVVGSMSSVGSATITRLGLPVEPDMEIGERIRLRVTFDRPILVDGVKVSGNAVEGRTIVPGAVFKGALHRRLQLAGEPIDAEPWRSVLSDLVIGHAFPLTDDGETLADLPLPITLVHADPRKDGKGVLGDATFVPFDHGAEIEGRPAHFPTDWKTPVFSSARSRLGLPEADIPRLARTHTAIRAETGTADEGKLFTTLARSVRREDVTVGTDDGSAGTPWRDRCWEFEIDLGRISDDRRPLARRLVGALLSGGLDGIGRTRARATFRSLGSAPIPLSAPVHGRDDLHAVVLDTAALMLDAVAECGTGRWRRSPSEAYEEYWRSALEDRSLELVGFQAAQAWKGGYIARRRRLGDTYHPFLLTLEGSVFLLRTRAVDRLSRVARWGLPAPILASGVAVTWENCPYVCENGYGRVRFHLTSADAMTLVDVVTPGTAGDRGR